MKQSEIALLGEMFFNDRARERFLSDVVILGVTQDEPYLTIAQQYCWQEGRVCVMQYVSLTVSVTLKRQQDCLLPETITAANQREECNFTWNH